MRAARRAGAGARHRREVRQLERSAIVALVLALASLGAAACGSTSSTGDQTGEAGGDGGPPRRYVPGYVPYDLPLAEAVELPEPLEEGEVVGEHVAIAWTDDPDPMPDEGSRVIKLGISDQQPIPGRPDGTDRLARPNRPEIEEQGGWLGVTWTRDDGRSAMLSAVGLDRASFEAAFESARAPGATDSEVVLPDGFREVARLAWEGRATEASYGPGGRGPAYVDPSRPGYALSYSGEVRGEPPSASFAVGQLDPSAAWLSAVTQTIGGAEVVDVGGKRGYVHHLSRTVSRDPQYQAMIDANPDLAEQHRWLDELVLLQWWDGDVVFVISTGPEAEALRMAESIEEVDDATWEAFAATATGVDEDARPELPGVDAPEPEPSPGPSAVR